MAIRAIRMYPDPVLREPATPVDVVDESVRQLARDMAETMYAAPGIGLAAPQVGVQRRVLVYRIGDDEEEETEELKTLVNPEIVSSSGEQTDDEGCLSIPGLAYPVTRAMKVTVTALGLDGKHITYDAGELEARVIQHEIDHLDGVLFIDRIDDELSREARRILRERALDGAPTPQPRRPAARI